MIRVRPHATLTTERTILATLEVSLSSRTGAWQIVAVTFFVAVHGSTAVLIVFENSTHTQAFSKRASRQQARLDVTLQWRIRAYTCNISSRASRLLNGSSQASSLRMVNFCGPLKQLTRGLTAHGESSAMAAASADEPAD